MDTFQFEIRNLTKVYNGEKALDIPHLRIKKGGFYAVMGPNGSGKTTFLSILSLLLSPTSGKIYFEGVDTSEADKRSLRQKMTLILQNPLLLNTTVEKNIAYGLKVRRMKKSERKKRVTECLELVGLVAFEKRRAVELSGGETQRVAIARALALYPEVLLLDEPTANVDRRNVDLLERILKELNRRSQITTILATHDINQAYRLADEVIPLFGGKIAKSPAENLFKGRVSKEKDISLFDTGRIKVAILPERDSARHISIPPEAIIISHRPTSTSARNSFLGEISEVTDRGDSVSLVVDVGEKLTVMITKESFQEMKLNLGSFVYLTFKSSSVEVF